MKEFWDSRYANKEFAYGEAPNIFFKDELKKIIPGTILLPADGEGRNSVYAAQNDWKTYACDFSNEGKTKAMLLANKLNVNIEYKVGDFGDSKYPKESFDVVALIYAHFPPFKKMAFHKLADSYLKPGGTIIFEAFGKNHLEFNTKNPNVGGPKSLSVLYSVDEIKGYFKDYEILKLEEIEIELSEGLFHLGKGSVVRFVGRKL